MNLDELFLKMIEKAEAITLPDHVAGSIFLDIDADDPANKAWLVRLADQKVSLAKVRPEADPSVSISISEQNLLKIVAKELSPVAALFTGKLKMTGDKSLIKQLQELLPGD
ncbi:MAG: SCP2 sterol-binding domain-containing protein [Deltaproteobacteria bacterium]|jgi:putative sterol carrier protein|nr:SCP2 sterol-binding domain-containing protein [Deltaproteobacteria bacterium]